VLGWELAGSASRLAKLQESLIGWWMARVLNDILEYLTPKRLPIKISTHPEGGEDFFFAIHS